MDGFIYLEPQAPPALTIAGAFPVFAYKQTNARLTGMDAKISYTLFREFSLEAGAAVLRAWDITNNDWIIQMPSDRLTGGFHWHFMMAEIRVGYQRRHHPYPGAVTGT